MIFLFWDVWQNSGKSFVGNVRGNMAMVATMPFCSCLHREAYVKAMTAESLAGAEDSAFGSA